MTFIIVFSRNLWSVLTTQDFYSHDTRGKDKNVQIADKAEFNYEDKNGNYKVTRSSEMVHNSKEPRKTNSQNKSLGFKIITKRQMELLNKSTDNVLEQSIVISKVGSIKGKKTLRPEEAQYTTWYRDWETDRKSTRLNSSH